MSALEIVAALNTVEQDHQLVLDKVRALKDAVGCLAGPPDPDLRPVLDRLREFNAFFATQFAVHLEEEETTLFPLLERDGREGARLASRLRQEHDELRRRRAEFEDCLELAADLEGSVPRAVLLDLLAYGWDFWEVLDSHAHAETRAFHERLNRALQGDAGPGARSPVAGC